MSEQFPFRCIIIVAQYHGNDLFLHAFFSGVQVPNLRKLDHADLITAEASSALDFLHLPAGELFLGFMVEGADSARIYHIKNTVDQHRIIDPGEAKGLPGVIRIRIADYDIINYSVRCNDSQGFARGRGADCIRDPIAVFTASGNHQKQGHYNKQAVLHRRADNFYARLREYDLDFFSIFNPLESIFAKMIKKKSILLNIFRGISIPAALFLVVSCRVYQYSTDITEGDLHNHLEYLSSDALDGRYPGTVGDAVAGKYLEEQFEAIGLQVRQQDFSFVQSVVRGPENLLEIKGQVMPPESFAPFPFSKDTLLSAPVVFAGYGLTVETDSFKWNDYQGLEIKDKWVLVFRGIPDIPEKADLLSMSSDDRDKAMLALDNGAAGILLVSGPGFDPEDALVTVSSKQASVGIPALQLSRAMADLILPVNTPVKDLESRIISDKKPLGFPVDFMVKAQTDLEQVMGHTSNWIGILDGSDPMLRNEYIVVGAHYDHLGTGGPGSSSRRPDSVAVHNGADDNASGVSAMLEIAAKLKKNQQELKRSLLFIAFGAEEMGLLGSKYFVNHSPVGLNQIDAMINLDMLGRLDTLKGIQIGGTGTSKEADSLIRLSNDPYNFKLKLSPEGSGPSDHSSFYGKNIPVFFITTGAHEDYHTPDDDADRINFAGLKAVSDLAYRLVLHIDQQPGKLTFREAGPREAPTARSRFKVTLGFMPDFSATDIEGVRVDFVTKGKAAERGGIMNGDIITAIDGLAIKNIYDYMYRLSKLSKNQIISVELLRNGQKEVLIIQL